MLLGPAPKASRPRHRAEHGVCVLVGEGRFRGTGSGNQRIQSKTKVLAVLGGPLGVWGLARLEQKESLMVCCSNTENLGVSILRSLRKGVGALTLVLQLELRSAASSPPQP